MIPKRPVRGSKRSYRNLCRKCKGNVSRTSESRLCIHCVPHINHWSTVLKRREQVVLELQTAEGDEWDDLVLELDNFAYRPSRLCKCGRIESVRFGCACKQIELRARMRAIRVGLSTAFGHRFTDFKLEESIIARGYFELCSTCRRVKERESPCLFC